MGILLLLLMSQRFDLLNAFAQIFGGRPLLPSNRKLMFMVGIALCTHGHAPTGFTILVSLIQSNCTADEIREVRMGISGVQAEPLAVFFACNSISNVRKSDFLSTDCAAELDWLLAVLHFQVSPQDSYRLYRKALRGQPVFRQRPDFWVELADLQLQLERYSSAKRSFLLSHSIESNNDCLFGAGTAALSAGELTAAEELLLKAGQGGIRGIGRLKLYAIRIIRRFVAADKVDRYPKKAKELLLRHSGSLVPKEVCSAILKLDPINAIAWRNLGMQHANDGETRRAAEMVLVAASLARDEGRYWAEAHFLMISLGKHRMAEQILNAGCWVKGPAFAADFKDVAENELKLPAVPPELLKDLVDRGSFIHQDAHDQADKRYSSWLHKINSRS